MKGEKIRVGWMILSSKYKRGEGERVSPEQKTGEQRDGKTRRWLFPAQARTQGINLELLGITGIIHIEEPGAFHKGQ
jgi:hypothetical protein